MSSQRRTLLGIILAFGFLLTSFVSFAVVYSKIYAAGRREESTASGLPALPTFFLSDAYNSRLRAKAAHELLLDWPARVARPSRWKQAGQPQFAPEKMVKEVFPRYDAARISLRSSEPLEKSELLRLAGELRRKKLLAAPSFRQVQAGVKQRLSGGGSLSLGEVAEDLAAYVEPYAAACPNPSTCRHILYGGFLRAIAGSAELSFEQLVDSPRFGDFLYFSVIAGTTTGYGDIVPVSRAARAINAIQILFTYCLLALITAGLVDWFRLHRAEASG